MAMFRRLTYVIGAVVGAIGIAMLPAAAVAAVSGDQTGALGILAAAFVTVGVGWIAWRFVGQQGVLSAKEGFATVGLAWFVLSVFGALPYLFTRRIPSITKAFFETASGFTTTGATILTEPKLLGEGLLFWRGLTQWLGGMGVIVLSIAILPLLGVGGVELAKAESPGPMPDRLTPRFQETARRLWLVYVAITAVEIVLLWLGDMTLYEAIIHSLTTMSTGGFGTEADSLTGFSAYTQWVVVVFMFIAGASFTLHFRALRDPSVYRRSREFVLYGLITIAAVVIVAGGRFPQGMSFEETMRESAFNSISIITTTGFSTGDFGAWRPALQIFMVGLMFIGGMAGSTAGGVKIFRVGL
ncbi:MAG: potassium transporter TrkG, partial [Acidimicrobiia bacterium]|nr:potassium transporter TrkG [Acidimicrobiia bacterium]